MVSHWREEKWTGRTLKQYLRFYYWQLLWLSDSHLTIFKTVLKPVRNKRKETLCFYVKESLTKISRETINRKDKPVFLKNQIHEFCTYTERFQICSAWWSSPPWPLTGSAWSCCCADNGNVQECFPSCTPSCLGLHPPACCTPHPASL